MKNDDNEPGTVSPVHATSQTPLKLGTRGSSLARWQSDWVAEQLRAEGVEVEIVVIQTTGDRVQDQSIVNIGAQGVFTKEIQRALLDKKIDLAVHSLKDLPTESVDGLRLAAVPKRGPHRDVFVSNRFEKIEQLPKNSRIGTGSLRRKTQIIHRFGDMFQLEEIRGNVETRLRKLDEGQYDALILAEAGLQRLGFSDRIRSFLAPPEFLPAVGQGALGLEIRVNDTSATEAVAKLCDPATFSCVLAERAFLRTLQGGCIAPIAALGTVDNETLSLHGRILSLDGKTMFENVRSIPMAFDNDDCERLGVDLAQELINRGADRILDDVKQVRTSVF